MLIRVSGTARCGKTTAAQLIKQVLEMAGAEVVFTNVDGDSTTTKHPSTLKGKLIRIQEERAFSGEVFTNPTPIRRLNEDVG